MIKYYCDRCGAEIKKGFNKPTKHSYIVIKTAIRPLIDPEFDDEFEVDNGESPRFHLCDCCTDLMDDFFNKKAIKGVE